MAAERIKLFQFRGIVRDYCLEYITENPDTTPEEAIPAVKQRLKEDFGESPWLEVLLQLVEKLLPLLLLLFTKRS